MRAIASSVLVSVLLVTQAVSFGQSVSVGTPTSSQSGTTTTVTIPVTVSSGSSSGSVTPQSSNLAFLDVTEGANDGTSGVQTLTGSFTTLNLTKVIADTANGWNAATHIYTVPTSGVYLIVSKLRLTDGTAPGIQYGQGASTQNTDGSYFSWSTTAAVRNYSNNMRLVSLNQGDQIRMFAYVDFLTGARVNGAELSIKQVQ